VIDPWAPLGLISATAALLALPVTPAFYELRKRTDVNPLPTSRHDGRIENFAEAFYSRIEPLRAQLGECQAKQEVLRTNAEGMEVLLVGRDNFDFDERLLRGISAVVCGTPACVPCGRIINADLYGETTLRIGQGATVRAALSAGDITLEENSAVLRWLHAYGEVRMRRCSTSYGRLSSLQKIHLQAGCGFQRLHAPTIVAGDSDLSSLGVRQIPEESRTLTDDSTLNPQRVRINGDFELPPGESTTGNLIVTGDLCFGAESRFTGSSKSYRDTVVAEGASVRGPIVCGGTVHLASRSFVAGPIIAERDVWMGRGVCIGTPEAPTTVSSRRVRIGVGSELHGTVWARVRGTVED
jgi:predicted acyltransferase (DUF342 family)